MYPRWHLAECSDTGGLQATGLMNQAWDYFEDQVVAAINGTAHKLHIPQDVIDAAANLGCVINHVFSPSYALAVY